MTIEQNDGIPTREEIIGSVIRLELKSSQILQTRQLARRNRSSGVVSQHLCLPG